MRVLLAGFEPWADSVNPAGLIAKRLDGQKVGGAEVVGVEVPEDFYGLPKLASSLVEEHKPDVVISVGWDYTPAIKVEMVAVNVMNAIFGDELVPDNSGHVPRGDPVVPGGPIAYQATLPVEFILRSLNSARIPAVISFNAGTHCCNAMMYSFLHAVKSSKAEAISGHIHVPPTPEMKTHLRVRPMKLETERKAIEVAITACVRHFGKR